MYIVLFFIILGILSGYLLRRFKLKFIQHLITILIWLLLFALGIEVGLNENIVSKFHLLGFEAFVIALFATAGSVLGAWWLEKKKS